MFYKKKKEKAMRIKSLCNVLAVLFLLMASLTSHAQTGYVTFRQLDSLQQQEKRPVVVFLHTSWCKYCGSMKATTFKNTGVVTLLQKDFYFVDLDIEEKSDILFRGHTFRFKPTGAGTGVHELAEQLGTVNGELGYPTVCLLSPEYEILYQKAGFMGPKELITVLSSVKGYHSK